VVCQDGATAIGFRIQEESRELRAAPGCLTSSANFGNGVSALKSAVAEGEAPWGKELRPFPAIVIDTDLSRMRADLRVNGQITLAAFGLPASQNLCANSVSASFA
jgi:hypothetical protein